MVGSSTMNFMTNLILKTKLERQASSLSLHVSKSTKMKKITSMREENEEIRKGGLQRQKCNP